MRRRQIHHALAALLALAAGGCAVVSSTPQPLPTWPLPAAARLTAAELPSADLPPPLPREFRGAWVASVANIDWPSRRDLPTPLQRLEMHSLLDAAQAIGLNAIILQVRPSADALYPSPLEPWAEYLTGAQGRAPSPFWDPLAEWLTEAHRRGLELHAWLNPYRARQGSATGELSPGHLSQRRPDLVRSYGTQLWIDPAEPDAARHTLAVARDLMQRYDLDGLHIDDYFYPYPVKDAAGAAVDFPDDPPWQRYRAAGGTLARADWRREHVDQLVQTLHAQIRQDRPWARFSISPFGIGKPALRPPGITGFSQYDQLYADVERWTAEGWMDALVPQLYWPIDRPAQAFGVLLDYWLAQNPKARHVWPGLFTSRLPAPGEPARDSAWQAQEILDQIRLTRARGVAGHVHFSMVALQQDRDQIATRLQREAYAVPALPPATPWLDARAPAPVSARIAADDGGAYLDLSAGVGDGMAPGGSAALPQWYAVWTRPSGQPWRLAIQPATGAPLRLTAAAWPQEMVVSAVSRTGIEGPRRAWRVGPV